MPRSRTLPTTASICCTLMGFTPTRPSYTIFMHGEISSRLAGSSCCMNSNVREHGFGVFRLWQEVSQQYPNFEFLHGHGLGVLGVGSHFVPQIENLFSASRNEISSHRVRNIFARLGQALTTQEALLQRTKEHQRDAVQWREQQIHYDALARELSDERTKHQNSVVQWRELQIRYNALARELSDERTRHQGSVAQWRELQIHYNALARELSDERTKHQDNVAQWRELQIHYDALARELSDERTELDRHYGALAEHAGGLERELDAIRMSTSWLITSPLRKAGKSMRSFERLLRPAFKVVRRTLTLRVKYANKHSNLESTIRRSNLVDKVWYISNNSELLGANSADPILHYLQHGAAEGRDPNPLFDTDWYMAQNPDVSPPRLRIRWRIICARRVPRAAIQIRCSTPTGTWRRTPMSRRPH